MDNDAWLACRCYLASLDHQFDRETRAALEAAASRYLMKWVAGERCDAPPAGRDPHDRINGGGRAPAPNESAGAQPSSPRRQGARNGWGKAASGLDGIPAHPTSL